MRRQQREHKNPRGPEATPAVWTVVYPPNFPCLIHSKGEAEQVLETLHMLLLMGYVKLDRSGVDMQDPLCTTPHLPWRTGWFPPQGVLVQKASAVAPSGIASAVESHFAQVIQGCPVCGPQAT